LSQDFGFAITHLHRGGRVCAELLIRVASNYSSGHRRIKIFSTHGNGANRL
jgi:hypothetical protein